MNNESNELGEHERRALAELSKEKMPPRFVEDQIVEKLRAADLIRDQNAWWPGYQKIAAAAVFALLLFTCGMFLGTRWAGIKQETQPTGFMLIVRAAPAKFAAASEADHLQRVKEYSAWARELEERGLLQNGEELTERGLLLQAENGSISELTLNASEGSIAGYFLLPAGDYQQALQVAKSCPNLKHGGGVELREIARH